MAMESDEILRWLHTLHRNSVVAIDDGGLQLVEVGGEAWLEVGGIPDEDDVEVQS